MCGLTPTPLGLNVSQFDGAGLIAEGMQESISQDLIKLERQVGDSRLMYLVDHIISIYTLAGPVPFTSG